MQDLCIHAFPNHLLLLRLCIYSPFRGQLTVPLLQLQLDGDVDIDVGTRVDEYTGLVEDDDDAVFMCSSVLNILLL